MTAPAYEGLPPTRVSLERRLRNICIAMGRNELRTRTTLAHTAVAQMLPPGVVKGGAAIKLRVGDAASRLTTDLDVARASDLSVEQYAAELRAKLAAGWQRFSGRLVEREPAHPADVPPEYVMRPFDVKLAYATQSYLTVKLELGHDEVGSTEDPLLSLDEGTLQVFELLGFEAPAPIPVLSVEHQIAQKLHACTTPNRHGGNDRAHDLVDLQILVQADPPDLGGLASVGTRLFNARRAAGWPPTVHAWPGWESQYRSAADGLDVRSLAEAIDWINELVQSAEG